ncbi:sugar kinase [Pontibacter sp. E15-1]|uniref:sugar kinase n=1 Tax=Pontibacter sp. E15-1 TaxID=2919918 RepID=UPI001F4F87E6|nr:sugar kinase [Pontibacter sp. E15-1]MCJ8167017.1 sugar kinase [Pontibacter sp. E15-1]
MRKKVITFGDIMLRLSTPDYARIIQSTHFEATYGGGEANVAVSLAQLGVGAAHVTRFPDNELGKAATNLLRKYGVDTQHIVYGGDRIGIYFLETGASVRASKVIYDRSNSAFAGLEPDMIDWDAVFADADWFHWTGITPAISAGAAACCAKAIEAANRKGLTVSADINYRKNLWQYGKTAGEVMPELIAGCDVIVAGQGDAKDILGITPEGTNGDALASVFSQLMKRFPKVRKIVNTSRTSVSATHNTLSGMLWDGQEMLKTQTYEINPIVDRIGGGDAFIAGYIYGQLAYGNDQKALDFGVAASVLKHTIREDANLATVDEVEALLGGNTSGRLVR